MIIPLLTNACCLPSSFFLSPVPFRHGEHIGFCYLVSQKYTGEKALVKVLHNSKVHEFKIKLATHKRLVAAHVKGRPPSYYIVAGFVFAAVSVPYLRSEVAIYFLFAFFSVHWIINKQEHILDRLSCISVWCHNPEKPDLPGSSRDAFYTNRLLLEIIHWLEILLSTLRLHHWGEIVLRCKYSLLPLCGD